MSLIKDVYCIDMDFIGEYAPHILFLNVFFLQKKVTFMVYVILIICITLGLKNIFKQPRPISVEKYYKSTFSSIEKYGMPSGHSLFSWFIMTYVFCITLSKDYFWLYTINIIMITNTMVHRIYYQYHNTEQVIIGSILGFLFGLVFSKV